MYIFESNVPTFSMPLRPVSRGPRVYDDQGCRPSPLDSLEHGAVQGVRRPCQHRAMQRTNEPPSPFASAAACPKRIPLVSPNPTYPTGSRLSHRIPLVPPDPAYPTASRLSHRIPPIPASPTYPGESHLSHRIPPVPPNPAYPTESRLSHRIPLQIMVCRGGTLSRTTRRQANAWMAGINPAMTRRGRRVNGWNLLDRIANSAGSSRGCGSVRAPAAARTRARCWAARGARYPARGSGSRRRRPRCRPW